MSEWDHRKRPVLSNQWIEYTFCEGVELPCDPDEAEHLLLRIIEIAQATIAHLHSKLEGT